MEEDYAPTDILRMSNGNEHALNIDTIETSTSKVQLEEIYPILKCSRGQKMTRSNESRKSQILSGSTFKNKLDEAGNRKKAPKMNTEEDMKQNGNQTRKKQTVTKGPRHFLNFPLRRNGRAKKTKKILSGVW